LHHGIYVAVENMFAALAPPAESVPPTVSRRSTTTRECPSGHNHRRERRDKQQLDDPSFVSATYALSLKLPSGAVSKRS